MAYTTEHNHNMILFNLSKAEIDEIHSRLKGMTYEAQLVDSECKFQKSLDNSLEETLNIKREREKTKMTENDSCNLGYFSTTGCDS